MVTRRQAGPKVESMSEEKEFINLMVYSDSGVGKTVFAGGHPKALILAADTGTISAARQHSKAKLIRIRDWEEFEEAQKFVRAGGFQEYDWIVIDSMTMLRERCMRHTLEREHAKNGARDEFIPAQPDHQKVQNVMKRIAETFCDLPVNVLFTALTMRVENNDGEDRVMPMIHGQKGDTSHYIAGLMDSVGYMELTENSKGRAVRRIHWQPHNEYIGKDRFGVLAPYTDDTNLLEIERRISGTGSPEASRPVRTGTRRPATTRRRTA